MILLFIQATMVGLSACQNYGGTPMYRNQEYIGCNVTREQYRNISLDKSKPVIGAQP